MDFGALTMDSDSVGSEPDNRNPNKNHGSGFLLKQDRSGFGEDHIHNWRSSKTCRTTATDDAFEAPRTMSYQQHQGTGTTLLRSNSRISSPGDGIGNGSTQNMLNFSTPNNNNNNAGEEAPFSSENGGLVERSNQNPPFRLYQQPPSYIRNAGYGSGAMNASLHSPFARYRGPFTLSQWMELEHQALIYKHIVANAPIPSNLLISLRKSLNSLAFLGSSSGSYAPNSFGWGAFHLGFAGNSSDPEPGRCRRTDGKKWRCSRDAVPEQKYCERHINRGRHRSRKPVEGQNGHAVSGPTTSRVVLPIASSPSASVLSNGGTKISLGPTKLQLESLQPVGPNPSIGTVINRMQDNKAPSMISPTISLKSKDSPFSIPKSVTFEESSNSEFGHISTDSLIYPSQKSSNTNIRSSNSFMGFDDNGWAMDQSDRSTITWAEELKSDWTCLSMSIPVATSDFSSSSNSPPQEKLALSPLSLTHKFDPIQLGEPAHKQTNWIPISCRNSMGGPLGEVLNSTSTERGSKSSSAPNLMTEVWDGGAQLGSSPTGVLQKVSFVSLSNSSSGSSPRGEKNGPQGGSF